MLLTTPCGDLDPSDRNLYYAAERDEQLKDRISPSREWSCCRACGLELNSISKASPSKVAKDWVISALLASAQIQHAPLRGTVSCETRCRHLRTWIKKERMRLVRAKEDQSPSRRLRGRRSADCESSDVLAIWNAV